MTTEDNKVIARRWSEELWNQADLVVADEIVAADYIGHDVDDPYQYVVRRASSDS